ncbi:MAG TPA: protein kinase [Actinomycetes bacterium]|jgi:serine/threonine-protein kinase|nr:protein kinase [Actinomycetes bacterium]
MTRQGQVLGGRYELSALLGAGGMASVYLATDGVLQRTVAVKVLGPPYDQHPVLMERFRREARAAAALNHPGIVAVYDSGSQAGVHYIVMEYVQGETLADILRRQGVLEPRRVAEVGLLVCQALAAAHARGLVHRDVKPANVLVGQDGQVKVADFGIARAAADHTLTGSGLLGTAAYLSPEQAQGGTVDARSDVYALGCVLYELLTGAPPFAGDSAMAVAARQVTEAPEPPSRRNPRVGPALEAVVMTALAKDPAQRYQTASAMGDDLARVEASDPAGAMPPPAGGATQVLDRRAAPSGAAPTVVLATRAARGSAPGLGRARRLLFLAVVGVVVVLVVGLWWLRQSGTPTAGRQGGGAAPSASTSTTERATTSSSAPTTTATTLAPADPAAALANLRQVLMAGQRQGTIDPAAEDLLKKAEDVVRAAQEGHADEVGNKLDELGRKVDELVREGKISPSAAGGVRQAVAQLAGAVQRSG